MKEFKVGDWVSSTKYLHMAPCKAESIFEPKRKKRINNATTNNNEDYC